jgi:hypothetical protein
MISWGLVGLDLSGFLGPVGLVHGMKQVQSLCAQFGYRGETCGLCLVLATGVTPVSFVGSGYRGETCKPVALGYSWVTKVQCHA